MDKVRIQFDVAPETLRAIDRLRETAGLATRAELFRRAIALYKVATEADKVLVERNGKRERVIP